MTRDRAPYLPTMRIYVWGGFGLAGAMGVFCALWIRPADWAGLVVILAAAQLTVLVGLAAFPLLRALGAVAPDARDAGRGGWRWVAYYAAFIGCIAAGYAARTWVLGTWFGWPTSGLDHAIRWGGPQPVVWLLLYLAEREAAERAEAAQAEAAVRGDIARLFESREALALAQARRHDAICGSLLDRVGPGVDAITAGLAAARQAGGPPDPARLDGLRAEIDALAHGELRALSHVLHPAIVRAGLDPALRSLAASQDDALAVQLQLDGDFSGLAPKAVLAAYRVVEAALDNVRRHAGAREARVAAAIDASGEAPRLRLTVADDGRGFAPAGVRRGVGFAAIDARVALAGGEWGVDARPGGGTCLWAELPAG